MRRYILENRDQATTIQWKGKMTGESGIVYKVDIQSAICLDFLNETDKIRIFGNL